MTEHSFEYDGKTIHQQPLEVNKLYIYFDIRTTVDDIEPGSIISQYIKEIEDKDMDGYYTIHFIDEYNQPTMDRDLMFPDSSTYFSWENYASHEMIIDALGEEAIFEYAISKDIVKLVKDYCNATGIK